MHALSARGRDSCAIQLRPHPQLFDRDALPDRPTLLSCAVHRLAAQPARLLKARMHTNLRDVLDAGNATAAAAAGGGAGNAMLCSFSPIFAEASRTDYSGPNRWPHRFRRVCDLGKTLRQLRVDMLGVLELYLSLSLAILPQGSEGEGPAVLLHKGSVPFHEFFIFHDFPEPRHALEAAREVTREHFRISAQRAHCA